MKCSYVRCLILSIVILILLNTGNAVSIEGFYPVSDFGAKGDGKTDDTNAIQKAIDHASKTGGRVYLPPGKYLVAGSLKVCEGVAVVGTNESPLGPNILKGAIILATGGKDSETSPALFQMAPGSTVSGLTIFYPEQKPDDIHPYPWTFWLKGYDNTVENITLINSYNGIRTDTKANGRHRIRSVYGCVLRRGVFIDNCVDIGRIENVHFHGHWWYMMAPEGFNKSRELVRNYAHENLEAFTFGRSDWQYCNNTFVFVAKIGYHFIESESSSNNLRGGCNGQFTGIGADGCKVAVQIERTQAGGLLITGGEFVSFDSEKVAKDAVNEECNDDIRQITVTKECKAGSIRFVNCSFWGIAYHNAVLEGDAFVSFDSCYFTDTGKLIKDQPLILAERGKLQVSNCTFDSLRPCVHLNQDVKGAIISGNNGKNGVSIKNNIAEKAIIANNEPVVEKNLSQ